MSEAKEWSRAWKASTDPSKQRKYRENAPYHQQDRFLNARLADSLRERVGTKTLPIRTGDKVKVMRGDHSGATGEVEDVDRDDAVVYVNGVDREAVDGSEARIALDPSNLTITRLDLDDGRRLERYEVSEAEKEEIQVEHEEEAGAEETEEETADEDAGEDSDAEQEAGDEADETATPESVVEGTVDEVKEAVEEQDMDIDAVLEAEKANKNRVTLVEWLETKVDNDE